MEGGSLDRLPRYRSHKIVRAAPLVRFGFGETVVVETPDGEVDLTVPAGTFARGTPALDDYIVVYQDGYVSWSPKAIFEEGYTRI